MTADLWSLGQDAAPLSSLASQKALAVDRLTVRPASSSSPSRVSSFVGTGGRGSGYVQPATLQIVLVGEPGVGCSAFIERWVTNQFRGESSSSASPSLSSPSTTAPSSASVGGCNSGVSHKVASKGLEDVACRGSCGQLRSQGETLLVLCWDVGSSD
eukprot:COSAG01_NODE_24810_length_765_cov_9.336336_1_plen_156_part_10